MARYSDDYDASDAASDAAADAKAEAIKSLNKTDPVFQWKWRIVKSVKSKINNMWLAGRNADIKTITRMHKSIAHLEKWCETQIEEELYEMADDAAYNANPMKYYGLSHSMFI